MVGSLKKHGIILTKADSIGSFVLNYYLPAHGSALRTIGSYLGCFLTFS